MSLLGSSRKIAAEFLEEQLQMDGIGTGKLSEIFDEEPPPLDVFLYDKKYLNHMRPTVPVPDESGYAFKLSPIQYDFVRNFEQIFYPELYISMVEEFGTYWTPLPMKHMFALEWGKGSTSKDTPIYDAETGEWTEVQHFKKGLVAAAYAEDGKVFASEGTDSFKEGEGRMFTVTTQSGRKSRVWEGHRFLAWNQERYPSGKKVVAFNRAKGAAWKRLWDLNVGDHIAVASHLPEPKNPLIIPDWEVEWVGLMIGDGCVSSTADGGYNHNLAIGYQSQIQLEHCVNLIEDQGIQASLRDTGTKYVLSPTNARKFNPMRDLVKRYGIAGHKAATKHIPKEFFRLSNRQIALLVSRLIDTDGWISLSNTAEVGYGTISERLADDVVRLFLRLGVVAEKKVKNATYKGELYASYQVRVRKQEALRKLLPKLTLLDKEAKKIEVLEWLDSRGTQNQAVHGDLVWDRIVSIEYDGWDEYWTLSVDGPASYVSDGGILDHNSGKDMSVRIGFTRVTNLLSCMRSPQTYYSMAATDSIQMLNVAATAQQARDAFFDPMKRLFISNKYLSSLFKGDDPAEGSHRLKLNKNITIISGNSMAENQEGLNLIAGVADEISAFKVAEEFRDKGDGRAARGAEQIVSMLRSSASSRFPHSYKIAQISWPRFSGDAIEKALAAGKASQKELGEASTWYVSGPHATWEVKPGVTKENFIEHYRENAEMAAAMYECRPPKATNAFIRDEQSIDAAFEEIKDDPIQVDYYWGYPPESAGAGDPSQLQEGWQVKFTFSPDLVPIPGALYCMHGDMAIKGDRAGIAMSHVQKYLAANGEEERPVIKNDFVFTFESDISTNPPREVQIRWYRQLIWELIERGFIIATVTFDQFQSFDMMQTLQMHGIDSGLLSLDRTDKVYQSLKDVILDGRLKGHRPIEHTDPLVVSEIKRLRRIGNKVNHPPSFSKDAADALAGSVFNAIEVGGQEEDIVLDERFLSEDPMTGWITAQANQAHSGNAFGLFGGSGPSDIMNRGYFHR